MIFQHTHSQVMNDMKTQTRRLKQAGDYAVYDRDGIIIEVRDKNGRLKYKVGNKYAVQPGRTRKGIGKIHLILIWDQHLQDISEEDAMAEGVEPIIITESRDWIDAGGNHVQMPIEVLLPYKYSFEALWNIIHTKSGMHWEDNSEVWKLIFQRVMD